MILFCSRVRNVESTNIMLDAFGVLYTEFSENILADKILKSDNINPTLVLRLLTHIIGKDSPPHDVSKYSNDSTSCSLELSIQKILVLDN